MVEALPLTLCALAQTLLRVWDAILCGGKKYLFKVTLAMFKYHEDAILATANYDDLLSFLATMPQITFDVDLLMRLAVTEFKNAAKLLKLRVQYSKALDDTHGTHNRRQSMLRQTFFDISQLEMFLQHRRRTAAATKGTVDREQFNALFTAVGRSLENELEPLFGLFNNDKSGQVSFQRMMRY